MKNIFMLTAANIRKRKSQSVTLLLFVLIAAMMLNTGLVLLFGTGNFFDERAEANNAAHFAAIYHAGTDGIEQGRRFIKNYPGVTETETLNLLGGHGEITMNGVNRTFRSIISRVDKNQKMEPLSLVGNSLPLAGDAIYIPYDLYINNAYNIGDRFSLILWEAELSFTVAGATEEIMFGSHMNSVYRFYVSDEKYAEMERQFSGGGLTLISARLENAENAVFMLSDANREISQEDIYMSFIYDYAKQSRTMIPQIAAIIITAFAAILLAVSLIVIRFRIINSIEESMTNIGAQKAVGYRSVQIILAIVTQFGAITFIGVTAGIALSQVVIPLITNILKPMLALVWRPGFDIGSAAITVAAILLAVMLISFLTSRRINKLHPLIALRGGLTTHSFRKNPFPLDKSRGSLNFLLALKQLLQAKKQAAAIILIIASVTMASVAGISVNYNMNEGQENFIRAFFGEVPDVAFILRDTDEGEVFKERMIERPETRKTFGFESTGAMLLVDETRIFVDVVEDSALLEGNMLISGRYPRHSNEIALGAAASRVTGKTTGDTVTVRNGEISKDYLVTGIVQIMHNNGMNGIITADGLREIQPDFMFSIYYIYLNDGVDANGFIENIRTLEGDIFLTVINAREQMDTVLTGMGGIFAAVAVGIIAVTVFVIILVLYMIIKTTILRRRRELGIQKAVGFTTFQLMNQTAFNMTPVVIVGVIIGAFAGYFGFSPAMGLTMKGFGIVQVDLPAPLGQIIVVCVALVLLAYAVSMLIAWRIRKISAYSLVSE